MPQTELETLKLAEKFFQGDADVAQIWVKKYGVNGETPQDVWKRIAKLTSEMEEEKKQKKWEEEFFDVLRDWRFIPGGRILFGLTEDIKEKDRRKVTLSNCFAMPSAEDNLESIMEVGKKMARTYASGGGCGTDLSQIRPKGSKVKNSAIVSDGVVPFAELFANITSTIAISGRRGALMLTIDCSHPDVMNFINCKRDLRKINHANISIKLTDAFFKAVEADAEWETYFKVKDSGEEIKVMFRAKEIFDTIIRNAWESAEPGILMWSRIKTFTPMAHFPKYTPVTTNPCSEIALAPYGACLLGSLNLFKFVKYGFTKRAEFDWEDFKKTIHTSVRLMDNILELQIRYNLYPFQEQLDHAKNSRQMGLGINGLADMLILLGMKYDSQESLSFVDKLFSFLRNESYKASIELAKEKGKFPDFDPELWLKSDFVKALPQDIQDAGAKNGIRNITLNTCAPNGTLSMISMSSSGIEPIFQLEYDRRVKLDDAGAERIIKVYHPLYRKYLEKSYEIPETVWSTAHEIDWRFRVELQGIVQKYIDNSISSTINLPADAEEETIRQIYLMAWKKGLKGITIYRDTSREGVLLKKKKRPYELMGKTYQVKDDKDITYYITINSIFEDLKLRPFEMFINSKETSEWTAVTARLVSAIMRRTPDIDFVTKQLRKSTRNPGGLLSLIAEVLEGYIKKPAPIVHATSPASIIASAQIAQKQVEKKVIGLEKCPQCGNMTLKNEGGCRSCPCGYGACAV